MKKKLQQRTQPKQYVVVVRHGHSHANWVMEQVTLGHYYSITGADRDAGLTSIGEQQTLFVAQLIRALSGLFPIDQVCSSDFERTLFMAHEIRRSLPYSVPLIVDDRLAKRCYGAFWNLTYLGLKDLFPEEHRKYQRQGSYRYRPPHGVGPGGSVLTGENYLDLKNRARDFKRTVLDTGKNCVLSTHSATKLTFRQLLVGMSNEELLRQYEEQAVPNGSVDVYCRNVGGRKWNLVATFEPGMDVSNVVSMFGKFIPDSRAA